MTFARRATPLALAVAWLLLFGSVATAAGAPPDQVDPPAEGEGEPLEDPADPPPPGGFRAAAYATVSVDLDGASWRRATVGRAFGHDRVSTAVKMSRMGWRDGARRVVVASRREFAGPLAASTLAGTVGGPLLLTDRGSLSPATRRELRRLRPRRVFVVGDVGAAVDRAVARMGFATEHVGGTSRYGTSMAVARRAVELGADPSTVIVASGRSFEPSQAVSALAAGRRHPVLLAPRTGERERLTRWITELGAQQTLVVGSREVLAQGMVRQLPGLVRIAGDNDVATAAALARHGRAAGLTGRPAVVAARSWADGATVGVMVSQRRDGVVLATKTRELSPPVVRFLRRETPAEVLLAGRSQLAGVVACQVSTGRTRSWLCAERELKRQGYDVRNIDGRTDNLSIWAVYAFKKVAGRSPNGRFGESEWQRLLDNPRRPVRRKDLPGTHVEIDLRRQLVLLVRNGRVAHHLHTSTGKPSTPTVRGTFSVYEKRNYRQANHMYRPVFFHGGYAFHGYPSIPLYPASHGCARMYDGNMDFLYPKLTYGMRVATY